MRSLSTRRRHPLAGVLVLLLGLLTVGALYSALAPRTATAATTDSHAHEQGRERCHARRAARPPHLCRGPLTAGALHAALAPRTATAETTDSDAIEQGRELFLIGC